jgi:hypothetical protein
MSETNTGVRPRCSGRTGPVPVVATPQALREPEKAAATPRPRKTVPDT